ncbi:MAG: hypothetical protein Q7R51_00295 [bacterium]|nr:hypothetical protein [bacterium]
MVGEGQTDIPQDQELKSATEAKVEVSNPTGKVVSNSVTESKSIQEEARVPGDLTKGKPILRQKTQENLQAQAEMFADRGVGEFSKDQAMFLKYSSELAKVKDLNNLPADFPQELGDLIHAHRDAYISFLRRESKLETSFIEDNIDIYKTKFQPIVAELKAKMANGNAKLLPEYLGSGSNGSAFRIQVEGKMYAAKFYGSTTQANFEIKPLLRAKGISHTAQLASYSFGDGVVIMELLPGKNVINFTAEDAPRYSDEHMIQLIETVRELDRNGIMIDPKLSNFMYDQEQGFSILDFHINDSGGEYGLPQEIISLGRVLATGKQERLDYIVPDWSEKDIQEAGGDVVYLQTMARYRSILQDKYPDILDAWKKRHEDDKKNPKTLSELFDRK